MHKPYCLVIVLHGLHEKAVILTVPISTVSKPSLMTKKVYVWSVFLQYILHEVTSSQVQYLFHNLSLNLWTVLLYGCPCSICIKFCADDAYMSICCASQVSSLLGGICNLAPISSTFSFACIFDMFLYCLEEDLLLETFSPNSLFYQLNWCGRKISS